MEYCFPLCVSIAFVFSHSSRRFENGMMSPKLDGSFPAGYRFGNRSGTCTKLNGLGSASDIVRIIKRVEEVQYGIRFWFQVEMGLAFEGRMKEMGGPVPPELLRICQKRGFWEDERGRRIKMLRKDKLNLRESDNRSLYLRLVAHAVIGTSGPKDLKLLQQLTQHRYRMVAKAAAVRLVELVGDEGIKILQSNVGDAIERRNAEPFGGAIREAEIEALKLADLSASVPSVSS